MGKISFCLVFALVVALQFYSVLCEENAWQSVIDQAKQSGMSQETIYEAQKALEDGTVEQVAEEAMGDASSLGDWVQQANEDTSKGSAPVEAPADLPDDEEEESPAGAPGNSPTEAPELAPKNAPVDAPELAPTNAPTKAPSPARQAQSPYAATPKA